MKVLYDNNHNVSYNLEGDECSLRRITDYWTPEKKKRAIPDLCQDDDESYDAEQFCETAVTEPCVADIGRMPFSAAGKLFFTRDGNDYVASAEVFQKNNIVLTAAHCIQDKNTGNLCENFLFERCYNEGVAAENLTFKTVALKEFWKSKKEWKWDYGLAILNSNSNAKSVLTYSTENAMGKETTAFGYPVNYYGGKKMVYVDGSISAGNYSGTMLLNGDKMRGGCSGGAWVLKGSSTVIGLNSYGPVSEKVDYMGSPVLDEYFDSLYQYVLSL